MNLPSEISAPINLLPTLQKRKMKYHCGKKFEWKSKVAVTLTPSPLSEWLALHADIFWKLKATSTYMYHEFVTKGHIL